MRVAGVEVGSVTDVSFVGDRVEVVHGGARGACGRASPRTSVASLGSVSLLGEGAVDITASSQRHAGSGVGLRAVRPAAGSLADVAAQATPAHRAGRRRWSRTSAPAAARSGRLFTDERSTGN